MKNNKLVQISTTDGLFLHGYYVPSNDKKNVILHIHGFEGNFYENNFVHVLANEMENNNIGFLTVNTRGNGRDTDFNTIDGKIRRIGARYELLEDAHLDISAWIKFLIGEGGYQQIILQGHSLGTVKVVRYLTEGELKNKISKIVLLCPFDKQGFMVKTGRDIKKLLKKAQVKVDEGNGEELVTPEFEEVGFSYKTFISWYGQDDLGRCFEFCNPDYDFPVLKRINIPTKIVVGSKDEYFYQTNPNNPEEAMQLLLKYIPTSAGRIIEGAIHSFRGYEEVMAKEVIEFVLK